MPGRPLLIGVTGGIGSGKSTVCKIFETLGHLVYYADDRAKWLMQNHKPLKKVITELFGEGAYSGAELNRSFLSEKVFQDPSLLQQLNALVHPAVAEDLSNWVSSNGSHQLLFDEAALLFETGSYQKMDATILVTAPKEVRIKRVLLRDPHRTNESIEKIIAQQMDDGRKRKLADYVIDNDGSNSIIKQSLAIYGKLI